MNICYAMLNVLQYVYQSKIIFISQLKLNHI